MGQAKPKLKPIRDQVIVITGASSGIGLATALMAGKKGAKVVLASRNTEDLNDIVEQIEAAGGSAFSVTTDVAQMNDVRALRDLALERFGRIDTWVNNAGVGIFGEIVDTPIDEARTLFDINFWGLHYGCMVALEAMQKDGGVIVNLGSEVSERSVSLQAFYSASKHAIKGYTEGLRSETEKKGLPVHFTLIRPAAMDTPFAQHAPNHLGEGVPSLPAPVYHPDIAAMAICEAAESGKRDIYIGGASKMVSMLNHIAPGLVDVMVNAQTKEQQKGTLTPHTPENEGLMSAPQSEGEMRGGHKGHVMRTSLWTSASLHPVLATVASVAAISLGALAIGAWASAGSAVSVSTDETNEDRTANDERPLVRAPRKRARARVNAQTGL